MQRRRMTCRATRVSSEWLSALQSQPRPGSRYGILPEPVRIRNGAGSDILAQDCTMWRGDSLSCKSISDIWYDKAEQKSEVQQDYFQRSVSLSVEDVLWAGLVRGMPGSCFPKHRPRWMGVVFFRSWTRYHPHSHYVKRECLAAQQCECHLFPATYPVIPKQRPKFLLSFPRSETGFCIWDSVFVLTIPLDEVEPSAHLRQHHQCSETQRKSLIWKSLFRSFASIIPWMALPHHHFAGHLSS